MSCDSRTGVLVCAACLLIACGGGDSPAADGGGSGDECADDYVLLLLGLGDDATGFNEIQDGDDLPTGLLPTGLHGARVSIRARGVDMASARYSLELAVDGATIGEPFGGPALREAPLGYEALGVWIVFEQDPAPYVGMSADLRATITDDCARAGSAEYTVVLTSF